VVAGPNAWWRITPDAQSPRCRFEGRTKPSAHATSFSARSPSCACTRVHTSPEFTPDFIKEPNRLTVRTGRGPAGSQARHAPTSYLHAWRRYPRRLHGCLVSRSRYLSSRTGMPSHPHARKRQWDGTTRDFGLQPPPALPLPLRRRSFRRA